MLIEDMMVFEVQVWSKIHLRHEWGIRSIEEIKVIPLTTIICARERFICWSRVIVVYVVDLVIYILGKRITHLPMHSHMMRKGYLN